MKIDQSQFPPFIDLSRPSLEGLAHILRHKELWPEGFTWDFSNRDHCAMGLTCKLWGETNPSEHLMAKLFKMTHYEVFMIFVIGYCPSCCPSTVADDIENYLASQRKPVDFSPHFP